MTFQGHCNKILQKYLNPDQCIAESFFQTVIKHPWTALHAKFSNDNKRIQPLLRRKQAGSNFSFNRKNLCFPFPISFSDPYLRCSWIDKMWRLHPRSTSFPIQKENNKRKFIPSTSSHLLESWVLQKIAIDFLHNWSSPCLFSWWNFLCYVCSSVKSK